MNHKSLRNKDIVWAPLVVPCPHVTGATAHMGHGHQVSPSHAMRGGCHEILMTIRMSLGWSGTHHDDTLHNADTTELLLTLRPVSLTPSHAASELGQPLTSDSGHPGWTGPVSPVSADTIVSSRHSAAMSPHISEECVYPMLTHLENRKTLGWV